MKEVTEVQLAAKDVSLKNDSVRLSVLWLYYCIFPTLFMDKNVSTFS